MKAWVKRAISRVFRPPGRITRKRFPGSAGGSDPVPEEWPPVSRG